MRSEVKNPFLTKQFKLIRPLPVGAPQFLRNFNNKSTHGMSIHMVIMWTIGDMFKTTYFVWRDAPNQFWICGTLQVSEHFRPARKTKQFSLSVKINESNAKFSFISTGELRLGDITSSAYLSKEYRTAAYA